MQELSVCTGNLARSSMARAIRQRGDGGLLHGLLVHLDEIGAQE